MKKLELMCLTLLIVAINGRKIKVQPRVVLSDDVVPDYYDEPEPQQQQQQQQQRIVLVSADQYNGLYGQPRPSSAPSQQREPSSVVPAVRKSPKNSRAKEVPREPPVQTIRNYNKVNDDGSFTFGYEAADGSFKEETRGTDCVVRGKYGYVDPDGNKREFTYVSGNPCDPNAPKEEEEEEPEEEDRGVANYPTARPRPVTTVFQNQYQEEEEVVPEQVLRPQSNPTQPSLVRTRPQYITRPQYVQPSGPAPTPVYRPRPTAQPIVSSTQRQQQQQQLPATTFRPQQVAVITPRPHGFGLAAQREGPAKTALDFDAEFQRFQQENRWSTVKPTLSSSTPQGQVYSSALLYDPATGQYKTQLYQALSGTDSDFTLNQRIQPYVYQQQPRPFYQQAPPQQQQQQQQFQSPQALYQAQQQERQFQSSAQLFAQQQRARENQAAAVKVSSSSPAPQPLYYVQNGGGATATTSALGTGQIDAFLRGHNIQF